ncbi:MAG: DUF4249 family protein [Bacteroidales bacterium]|nr:DUF4249 family protein [Bacteroidales bacterium]
MKKSLVILFVLMLVSSCIYPYTPDVSDEYGRVVIEGDISLGTVSHFSANQVVPFDANFYTASSIGVYKASFKVEAENGLVYNEIGTSGDIDLTAAGADTRYRMVAEITRAEGEDAVVFASDWQEPAPAPEIGRLVESAQDGILSLALNLSSDYESGCYRWEYEELYHYRSPMGSPTLELDLETGAIKDHTDASDINEVLDWWKYEWCWMETSSRRSAVAIAKSLQGSTLKNHEFLTIPTSSDKLAAGEYYLRLIARSIPEAQYRYLNAVNEGSEKMGSLFSPVPGEQIGNIRNVADPDDYAIGYVGVNRVAKKLFHIYTPGRGRFFNPDNYATDILVTLREAYPEMPGNLLNLEAYKWGYYPYVYDPGLLWLPTFCYDCRLSGGTPEKPKGWD